MRSAGLSITSFLLVLALASAGGALYPEWALAPCQPNPFCNLATGAGTTIYYRVGCDCHVTIEITDGTMVVVRTLVDAWHAAGTHSVFWDGRDEAGIPVPDGTYRYTLVACDEIEQLLYTASDEAHVWCASLVLPSTWGRVKALYRP